MGTPLRKWSVYYINAVVNRNNQAFEPRAYATSKGTRSQALRFTSILANVPDMPIRRDALARDIGLMGNFAYGRVLSIRRPSILSKCLRLFVRSVRS